MQKLNTVLIVLLAAAVIYLLVDRQKTATTDETMTEDTGTSEEEVTVSPNDGRIAYINIDSLNENYAFLDDMMKKLEAEQSRAQGRMQSKMKKAQERAQQLQSTVQTMTEQDYYAAQEELQKLEVDIQKYQERLANELVEMENEMQSDLNERIHSFLVTYNEDQGYDYVLGFQQGGQVLFGKEALDITDVTIEALNERYAAENVVEEEEE